MQSAQHSQREAKAPLPSSEAAAAWLDRNVHLQHRVRALSRMLGDLGAKTCLSVGGHGSGIAPYLERCGGTWTHTDVGR